MEILAQYGTLGPGSLYFCSLYGLVMLTVNVALAFYMKKPEKDD
jgi:hypothetical protein